MRAVISGASRGIGKAIAIALAREGIDLAITSTKMEDLEKVRGEILGNYTEREVLIHACDLTDYEAAKAFAKDISDSWDNIDIIVNNAGLFLPGRITEEPVHRLKAVMDANFYSAYYLTRAFLPLLLESKPGYIFNMSSIAALGAYESGGAYGIAKAALLSLSRTLRAELKNMQIKVTAILPGATYTDSWAASGLPEERFMQAEDISEVVLAALRMGPRAVLEEVIIRPQPGDI